MEERLRKKRTGKKDDLGVNRHKKRLQYLKTRRDLRKVQISISRFRALGRFIAILAIAWCFYKVVNLPQWYLDKDVFAYYPNGYLEIEDNSLLSTERIMQNLKQIKLPTTPVYMLNTSKIEKNLLTLSPVKKVYIRRFWFPARLNIRIEEKTPILAISPKPNIVPAALFASDYSIIGREFLTLNSLKDVYSVLTYYDYHKWSARNINFLVYFCKTIEAYSGEKLRYLDIRNPDDVYVRIQSANLRIGEFNGTLFHRVKRINSVLSQSKKFSKDIDYIDLRWDSRVFIKLKEKPKDNKPDNPMESSHN